LRYWIVALLLVAFAAGRADADDWEVHLHSDYVTAILAHTGTVLWGSEGGAVVHYPSGGQQTKIVKSVGGLASNRIKAVGMEESGRLWLGTEQDGVSVLAGGVWTTHSTDNLHLLSDEVLCMDSHGDVTMVGTSEGVSLFEDGEFGRFFNGTDWGITGCDAVVAVAVGGGEALVATECGLFSYDLGEGTWRVLIGERDVHGVSHDDGSLFWIVAADPDPEPGFPDSIYTWDGVEMTTVSRRFLRGDDVRSISAADTVVWAATSNGPKRFDAATGQWIRFDDGLDSRNRNIRTVSTVNDSTVWIGTIDGAAVLVDGTWEFRLAGGPASNYVQDVCVDGNGQVWFTTGYRWGTIPGSNMGIMQYDGATWGRVTLASGEIPTDIAFCCETDPVDGSVWLGFWDVQKGDLLKYDIATGEYISHIDSIESRVISDIYVDPAGTVVFGEYLVGLGLLCPDGTDMHYAFDDGTGCINSQCLSAVGPGPEGSYMIGGYILDDQAYDCIAEIAELDLGEDCSSKADDLCRSWTPADDWAQGHSYAFAVDDLGVIWLGTAAGLSSFDGMWREVNTSVGAVWDIAIDSYGTRWVATDEGLMTMSGSGVDWTDFTGKVEIYDETNSPLDRSPVKALEFGADGALWIGTGGGGIYKLSPDRREVAQKVWLDVYPNPYVESNPDHTGIAFSGYRPGSKIRIYTLEGQLVAEIDASGAWTREKMQEMDVASGVYIYHGHAEDGREFVGRFVVVR
jgi:hypothetical protein